MSLGSATLLLPIGWWLVMVLVLALVFVVLVTTGREWCCMHSWSILKEFRLWRSLTYEQFVDGMGDHEKVLFSVAMTRRRVEMSDVT